jgi:hypothetical protein
MVQSAPVKVTVLHLETEPQLHRNHRGFWKHYTDDMTTDINAMRLGAQQTLDELFAESLIPFRLSAYVVDSLGSQEYIIRFHDSRLRSIDISWQRGQTFKSVFRTAVLARVARLTVFPRLGRAA